MFLNNLLKTRVVELGELGEVVDVGNDVAQVLLEQVKVLFLGVAVLDGGVVGAGDGIVDFLLRGCYAADNLLALDALEGVDLVELLLEMLDEALLRLLVPGVVDA